MSCEPDFSESDFLTEQWRTVADSRGFYEVSDLGRVRSWKKRGKASDPHLKSDTPRILSQTLRAGKTAAKMSYKMVYLQLNFGGRGVCRDVHTLVAETFDVAGDGPEVRHLDGNHLNNRVSNLRYGTRTENVHDAIRHDTWVRGERHKLRLLSDALVKQMRDEYKSGLKPAQIARKHGVNYYTAWDAIRGKSWKHLPMEVD